MKIAEKYSSYYDAKTHTLPKMLHIHTPPSLRDRLHDEDWDNIGGTGLQARKI